MEVSIIWGGYLIQNADYNPHNWIVAVISRGGIVGVILAIMIITVLINRFRGEYDNDIVRGSACFAISMLIQGLAEIVLLLVHMIFSLVHIRNSNERGKAM